MRFLQPSPLALPFLVSSVCASIYNGYNSTYSFDLSCARHPAWMSALSDSTPLTSISIPGTHDTMTSDPSLGSIYQCQNHNLSTQLAAGIRYVDVRLTNINDSFFVYHEDHYTGFTYTDVLNDLFTFLQRHPSETVLMRLKEESSAINSSTSFEDLFNQYRLNSSLTPQFATHLWLPPSSDGSPTPQLPLLGALRSKILLLQNFGPSPAAYGISWDSDLFAIEDMYEIASYAQLDDKFAAIEANLLDAQNRTAAKLYLSHVSGSVGVVPIEVAAGTKDGAVEGENDRVGVFLDGEEKEAVKGPLGVVILDFPGAKLVDEIVRRNSA